MEDQEVDCVTKFCRLCLEDEDLLEETMKPEVVEDILQVNIFRGDGEPLSICKACETKIGDTRSFWELIIKTQIALKALSEDSATNVKPEGYDMVTEEKSDQPNLTKVDDEEDVEMYEVIDNDEYDDTVEYLEAAEDDVEIQVETVRDESQAHEDEVGETQEENVVEDGESNENEDGEPNDNQEIQIFIETEVTETPELDSESQSKSQSTPPKKPRKQYTPRFKENQTQYSLNTARINKFYNFTCTECDINFNTYLTFRLHSRNVHDEPRPFIKCCKRKLTCRTALIDHLNLHLNPEELTCPICSKQQRDSYQYKVHLERHKDPQEGRTHECTICQKRFFHHSLLKTHYLTHLTQEQKEKIGTHKCPHCDKSFIKKAYMDHHIRLVHLRVYEQICDICARPFKSKAELNIHKRGVHQKKEPIHQCPHCDLRLGTIVSLNSHIKRQHEEAGVFTCEICNKQTHTLTALKNHVKFVHTMTGSHICGVCGKGFKKALSLKEHMSMHVGGYLYNCPYCEKTFRSNANMYSHKKRMHPQSETK